MTEENLKRQTIAAVSAEKTIAETSKQKPFGRNAAWTADIKKPAEQRAF